MSDLIDRQAAIDACMKYNGAGYVWACIMGDIRKLPSAQPEKSTEKRTETNACDLISRQAAIDAVNRAVTQEVARWSLQELPSAQPVPKRGKWMCWHEKIENDSCTEYIPHCKCSECGTEYDSHTVKFINFCPNCGACMKGEQDEAD